MASFFPGLEPDDLPDAEGGRLSLFNCTRTAHLMRRIIFANHG